MIELIDGSDTEILLRSRIKKLEQENQQLKERINAYENPEDLTLMFMYCDEQAKDKIKLYKQVLDEIILQLKVERKFALSLNKPYTVSVIDKLLDRVK